MPNSASSTIVLPDGIDQLLAGHTMSEDRNADRQPAGSMETDFFTRMITSITASENVMAKAIAAPAI
jgi:hypothetical protein